jgi:hypothetical protein
MPRNIRGAATLAGLIAVLTLTVPGCASQPDEQAELLKVRETVWRAWFTNDTKTLEKLVPRTLLSSALVKLNGRNRQRYFRLPPSFRLAEDG